MRNPQALQKLRAAIVGLGKVGIQFDDDPKRQASGEIWTHFSAYQKFQEVFELVAVVDSDISKFDRARARIPHILCFSSVEEMLSKIEVDVVSICTPDALHLACIKPMVGHVKGVFLEKPFSSLSEIHEARRLTDEMKNACMCIRVNYYKTKEFLFLKASDYMNLRDNLHVSVRYSGPFDAVGSHGMNLLISLVPNLAFIRSFRFSQEEGDGFSALFQGHGNRVAELIYCGPRHKLIFELDIIGNDGRVLLEENFSSLRVYEYKKSKRYSGYRELVPVKNEHAPSNSERFVPFLMELGEEVMKRRPSYENLYEALKTQELMGIVSEKANE